MALKTDKERLLIAYGLFKDMQEDNLEYTYRGIFNTGITDNILSLAETNLFETKDKRKIKKRVYFIMVEGLQNITRHQEDTDEINDYPGLFAVQRKNNGYYITTGNLIHGDAVPNLSSQLEKINSLDAEELKEYSRNVLTTKGLSEKGGAGLGLIEIARRSGKKLLFDFKKIDNNYHYFYLHTEIPFEADKCKQSETTQESLTKIKNLHALLDKYNIVLNFSGIFNQENLINLLSIIENQMGTKLVLKARVYNIMVEMLQNILKHGDDFTFNNIKGHYGIFFISEQENEFVLTAGNYIENRKIDALNSHLKKVNSLDKGGLDEFYSKTLLNFKIDDRNRSGLGIIDMRLKSKRALRFNFSKTNDEFSFFTLQVVMSKVSKRVEPIMLEATADTPAVVLDADNGQFVLEKKSIPENAFDFYKPIINWVKRYARKPNELTVFEFKFSFINSSSLKQLAKLMFDLQKVNKKGEVVVKWYYNKADEVMTTAGLRLSKLISFKFEMVEIKND